MRWAGFWRPFYALGLLLEVDLRLRLTGFARLKAALVEGSSRLTAHGSRQTRRAVSCELRAGPPRSARRCPRERSELRADAERLELWLRWTARFIPGARCLHRSLALMLWLRRRGVRADLRMGVCSRDGAVQGHAWVEWDGVPIGEAPSVREEYELLEAVEAK